MHYTNKHGLQLKNYKEAAKSVAQDVAKGTVDNVKDEYGLSEKSVMPYYIIREERDKAIAGG